ncbi:unnamed protein product [Nesidiocoris tenuis]|uniref:Transmembrane protein 222 n=1 Tax=Nesidiocoris tenuis TaxID=355587 RepID=A0A6H5HEP0_9HEMI|nr:unnamed protein product [Nesidiocoris tenuis]
MAYNHGPGYIDVTQQRPREPDEECIMRPSELDLGQDMANGRYSSGGRRSPRYPYCIVWTPIPLITYIFPFIGHMGICKSNGVIRDFAASYHVSEDAMAFGDPTKIVQLDSSKIRGHVDWDTAIEEAAQVYCHRMHNLCCDNCHSMVALALNKMQYNGKCNWNMVNVWALFICHSRYVRYVFTISVVHVLTAILCCHIG